MFTVLYILKGYAKSKDQKPLDDTASFLTDVIAALKLDRPVLVSPSLSGSYTLPFLLGAQPEKAAEKCRGYVPVAPIYTDQFEEEVYKKCQVSSSPLMENSNGPEILGPANEFLKSRKLKKVSPIVHSGGAGMGGGGGDSLGTHVTILGPIAFISMQFSIHNSRSNCFYFHAVFGKNVEAPPSPPGNRRCATGTLDCSLDRLAERPECPNQRRPPPWPAFGIRWSTRI